MVKMAWCKVSFVFTPCSAMLTVTSVSWPGLPSASSQAQPKTSVMTSTAPPCWRRR
jgi:hypothetical protein